MEMRVQDRLQRPAPLRIPARELSAVVSAGACQTGQPAAWRERAVLLGLALCLGFGQGCGLCFFVGCSGYFGNVLSNPKLFVYLCAFFYLPPILLTIAAVRFDRKFNISRGIRVASKLRIYFSGVLSALLLASMCLVSDPESFPGQGAIVYSIGVVLSFFVAALLSASCSLLGVVDSRLVPIIILGQTAAGVYTNIVAHAVGFAPGCAEWQSRLYWAIAALSTLLAPVSFAVVHACGALDKAYAYHEGLLFRDSTPLARCPGTPSTVALSTVGPMLRGGSIMNMENLEALSPTTRQIAASAPFPRLCWSMAVCQTLAIGMNMSLTPQATQIAQGDYLFTQEVVLTKLLSDFVGRILFLFLPKPELVAPGRGCRRSLSTHAVLVWMVEVFRLPLWSCVYLRSHRTQGVAPWTDYLLGDKTVLLYVVWLPLISLGAFSSSWCTIVAVGAAPETIRDRVTLLMTASIYAGYFLGIVIALVSTL
eukprot:TRINITY_DN54162_c0_g1_i1.p1 TRINITY_DN54162_c0_g1~~TRINITY_DN54162_c0_g1_i1.p1  ORF type:complete len:480 (+),score=65.77 TRINITY_DN54162_c0_g1_i1:68-1507(+)